MVKNIIRYLFPSAILAMSCISTGCGKGQHATETQQDTIYSPSYAKGFIITGIGEGESTIIKTLPMAGRRQGTNDGTLDKKER